jgi:MFS transporter, DHA2 family, multidrug resistance protein
VRGETFVPVPNRGMITLSIMMANIMQGVDNSILNVALPHVQGSLSASLDQIAWALTSYIVCAAIMMPLTGWLAGRFGIKYIFLVSVIGFTLASALCGTATSLGELVLFRALQGVAGPVWSRCRRRRCCRSTRRNATDTPWRCSAWARSLGRSWGRRSAAG